MKYIILSIAMVFSIAWHWVQSTSNEQNQYTQFQVEGKVVGLRGNMVLKIEDTYLNLAPLDRFTLIADAISQDQLAIQVFEQPNDQRCELLKSMPKRHKVRINISCQTVADPVTDSAIAGL